MPPEIDGRKDGITPPVFRECRRLVQCLIPYSCRVWVWLSSGTEVVAYFENREYDYASIALFSVTSALSRDSCQGIPQGLPGAKQDPA